MLADLQAGVVHTVASTTTLASLLVAQAGLLGMAVRTQPAKRQVAAVLLCVGGRALQVVVLVAVSA